MLPEQSPLDHTDDEDCVIPLSRRFTCKTGGNAIRDALAEIRQMVNSYDALTAEIRANCEVVLAEVLNNIAEHSYKGCKDREFSVEVALSNHSITVETLDFGEPMPGLELPEKRLPSPDVSRDALPEGGFGWYLIHVLAPDPIYMRQGNKNVLRFVVATTPGTAAQ